MYGCGKIVLDVSFVIEEKLDMKCVETKIDVSF